MLVTIVWLGQSMGLLGLGPGFIPGALAGVLELILFGGIIF